MPSHIIWMALDNTGSGYYTLSVMAPLMFCSDFLMIEFLDLTVFATVEYIPPQIGYGGASKTKQ